MTNPIGVQLSITQADMDSNINLLEALSTAQSLVILSAMGELHTYYIENVEEHINMLYIDILLDNLEEYKKNSKSLVEPSALYYETDSGILEPIENLSSYNVNEVAEFAEEDTYFYNPITFDLLIE